MVLKTNTFPGRIGGGLDVIKHASRNWIFDIAVAPAMCMYICTYQHNFCLLVILSNVVNVEGYNIRVVVCVFLFE